MVVKIWPNAKFLLPLHPILDDGVMVTLQVLVLSFPVRIRVVQLHNGGLHFCGSLFFIIFKCSFFAIHIIICNFAGNKRKI